MINDAHAGNFLKHISLETMNAYRGRLAPS
jgi:hypothetical protein